MDGLVSCDVRIRGCEALSKELAELVGQLPTVSALSEREEHNHSYDSFIIQFKFNSSNWKGLCSSLMTINIKDNVDLILSAKGEESWKVELWKDVFIARRGSPSKRDGRDCFYFTYVDEPSSYTSL